MSKKICYITTLSLTIRAFFIPQLKYLAENGYEVCVICSPDKTLQQELGENIRFIPVSIARGISPSTLLRSIKELKKVFDKESFDIVQYSTPNAAFCASIAAKLSGVKIRNYHLMGLRYLGLDGLSKTVFKFLEKLTCKLSTHIECITKSNMKMSVEEKLFPASKATIVWNGSTGGVDLARFDCRNRNTYNAEIREKLSLSEDDFVFGFIGRITKDKGINEILQAFNEIKSKSKLLILGQKEAVNTIDPVLWENANNNSKIIIHDSVTDIEKYYAAIDVLLLPSYREGFGMVIAEAAAMGTPSIVSNIPGPVDAVIPNKTALIVKVKDAQDLKEKMEMFIDHPELCEQMGKECIDFISKTFDNRVLCEKILERKDSLLAQL